MRIASIAEVEVSAHWITVHWTQILVVMGPKPCDRIPSEMLDRAGSWRGGPRSEGIDDGEILQSVSASFPQGICPIAVQPPKRQRRVAAFENQACREGQTWRWTVSYRAERLVISRRELRRVRRSDWSRQTKRPDVLELALQRAATSMQSVGDEEAPNAVAARSQQGRSAQ